MFSLTDEADLALDVSLATKLWSLKEPDANTIGYLLMSSAIIARLCIFYSKELLFDETPSCAAAHVCTQRSTPLPPKPSLSPSAGPARVLIRV